MKNKKTPKRHLKDTIFVKICDNEYEVFEEYKKIVPELSRRLSLHHSLYSGSCNATLWEEHCANALIECGFGSDWEPTGSHQQGVDQVTDSGLRISNKGGKITEDLSKLNISGFRTTQYKTMEEKLKFLSLSHEDVVFSLATHSNFDFRAPEYFFIAIDSNKLNYHEQNWIDNIGRTGSHMGWKCSSDYFDAQIQKSMSHQLWTNIYSEIFEFIIPIDVKI